MLSCALFAACDSSAGEEESTQQQETQGQTGGNGNNGNTPSTPTNPTTPQGEATLSSIEIEEFPRITYEQGEEFDPSGLKITVRYTDGTQKSVSYPDDALTVSSPDMSAAGEQIVRVSYSDGEASTSADITVYVNAAISADAVLMSIEIITQPQTEYMQEDEVSLAGLVVRATYDDGTSRIVSYDDEPERFSSEYASLAERGTFSNTLTYTDEKVNSTFTNYLLTVTQRFEWSFDILTFPTKTVYGLGEALDPAGLTIQVYLNGEAQGVEEYGTGGSLTFTGFDSQQAGEKTVTVAMGKCERTFTVTVIALSGEATLEISADGSYTISEEVLNAARVRLAAKGGMVDVGGFYRATLELRGREIVYDYKDDIAGTTFSVKMSDVTSELSIYGVSSYVYNDTGDDMRAVKFADTVKNVNIDLENKETDLSYKYAGGVIANNASVSLSNANNATLSGFISTDGSENRNALKDSALIKGLKSSSVLPTFNVKLAAYIADEKYKNLYDTGIDEVINNYYSKNAKNKMNPSFYGVIFDAKSYLNGANMFDETNREDTGYYKGNAYELSANAAALMLNGGVSVSNVAIIGKNDTGKTRFTANMANIYTTTDWSSITSSGYYYGMMYFVSKPPSALVGSSESKVVIKEYNGGTTYDNDSDLDISALSDDIQETIYLDNIHGTVYFKSGINRGKPNTTNAYIFGSKYKGVLDGTYTNASIEDYGNDVGNRSKLVPISQTGYEKID